MTGLRTALSLVEITPLEVSDRLSKTLSQVEITPLEVSDRTQENLVSGRDYPTACE